MPAFQATDGMPYWMDLATADAGGAAEFYRGLLDWESDEVTAGYRLERVQGLPVAGIIPQGGTGAPTWVTYFLSLNLDETIDHIGELGGQVLAGPTDVYLGRMAVAADPMGGLFGLLEPGGEERFVAAGEPGTPVWHELTTTADPSERTGLIDFYARLFGWTIVDEGEVYATAIKDGAPFVGFRSAADEFNGQAATFWQSFVGIADLQAGVETVKNLGGEVIRAPFAAEFGRLSIIADPTGAVVTLCEISAPEPEAEAINESDDIFEAARRAGLITD